MFVALIAVKSNIFVSFLHTLLYNIESEDLFQPSFHMLPVTWRCDDTPVQLVVGGELLTPAANQMSLKLDEEEDECCEGVTVMEEVGVSGGVVRPDMMPS